MEQVRIFVGFDQREAAAYHVFCQSVMDQASVPVSFHPLHQGMLKGFDGQRDGSNAFIYSRFLVPYLCGFSGHAIFADGDMVCDRDIAGLWEFCGPEAVRVVKHDYQTKHERKYVGTPLECANDNYPCKNWSSVMLWNCAHPAHKVLTPEFVGEQTGAYLHRFEWLKAGEVGALPGWWNRLVGEEGPGQASLYHFTLGVPGIQHYADEYASWKWHGQLLRTLECPSQRPSLMVKRAESRVMP